MDPPAGTLAVSWVKDASGPAGETNAVSPIVPIKPFTPSRFMVRLVEVPGERVSDDLLA